MLISVRTVCVDQIRLIKLDKTTHDLSLDSESNVDKARLVHRSTYITSLFSEFHRNRPKIEWHKSLCNITKPHWRRCLKKERKWFQWLTSISLVFCVSPGKCHPSQVIVGDDLCLCAFRKPSGLWWSGQHVLHLQPQGQGWERQGHAWAGSTHR